MRRASSVPYRKEATIRVAYLSGAALLAAVAGLLAGLLMAWLFPGTTHDSHGELAAYTGFAIFAVICGLLVYRVDRSLNKRFNQNP